MNEFNMHSLQACELMYRQIRQQYVYGNINQLESLMEANLQIYTPNTRFWWRMQVLEYGPQIWQTGWVLL